MSHPWKKGGGGEISCSLGNAGMGKVEGRNILGVESGTIQDYVTSQMKLQSDKSPAKIILMGQF